MDKELTINVNTDESIVIKESNNEEFEESMHILDKIQIGPNRYICFA